MFRRNQGSKKRGAVRRQPAVRRVPVVRLPRLVG